jgi:hypothetical protein
MRSLSLVRNYCLLVFFIVVVGGVVLQPGNRETQPGNTTVQAGFGQ